MSAAKYAREYYVDIVEKRYFANVDAKNMQAVLDCFNPSAVFTIQSAFVTHEGRDTGVRRMFENLFTTYRRKIVHKNFRHIVDLENHCCASQFEVELIDPDGKDVKLSNCNFFYLKDGKFERVYVYMSGPNVLV